MRKISKVIVPTHVAAGALGVSLGASLMLTTPAQAAYSGLSVQLHSIVNINGTNRSVYRVYADFTDPADRLHAVYGSPTLGALSLQSLNALGTGAGSAFFNSSFNGPGAPSLQTIGIDPDAQWDTFSTIGVSVADQAPYGDKTSFSPGFDSIAGSSYASTNSGWYVTPSIDHDNDANTPDIINPQAEAGFAGDGDVLNRVLFLQLTVNAGEHVAGTVNLALYNNSSGVAGGTGSQIFAQQTFSSVPGPGAILLLGLAGLSGSRRSRK